MPSEQGQQLNNFHYSCCAPRTGLKRRTSMSVCGIMLVIAGLAWLSARMGWLPAVWPLPAAFWPSVLIIVGIWIVVKSSVKRNSRHHE
jgi:hypothetical protein